MLVDAHPFERKYAAVTDAVLYMWLIVGLSIITTSSGQFLQNWEIVRSYAHCKYLISNEEHMIAFITTTHS